MADVRCSDFLDRKSPIPMPMFRLHSGLVLPSPSSSSNGPVRSLVSFAQVQAAAAGYLLLLSRRYQPETVSWTLPDDRLSALM